MAFHLKTSYETGQQYGLGQVSSIVFIQYDVNFIYYSRKVVVKVVKYLLK